MSEYTNKKKTIRLPFFIEAIALCVIPFEEALSLPVGSVLRILNLLNVFFCILLVCKGDKKILIHKQFRWLVLFFILTIISYIWCYNTSLYFDRLSTYGLNIVLIILLTSLYPNRREAKVMLYGLWLGGLLASWFLIFGHGISPDLGNRTTLIIFGRYINPNVISYSVMVSLLLVFFTLLNQNYSGLIKGLLLGTIISEFLALISLGSRGGFISTIITLFFIILNRNKGNNRVLHNALLTLIALAVLGFIYSTGVLGPRFTIDNLIGKGELGTANRFLIWDAAITQIKKRPLLGYGNGSSIYAIGAAYKIYGTHNSYFMILLEFGIIGFLVLFAHYINFGKKFRRNCCFIGSILLLSQLLSVCFVEGFSTKLFWGVQIMMSVLTMIDFEDS